MDDETPLPKQPLFTLDRSTLVPLGLLVSVLLSAVTGTVWINSKLLSVEYSLTRLNDRIAELQAQMSSAATDRWTKTDMAHWVELVNAGKPDLKLPLPR